MSWLTQEWMQDAPNGCLGAFLHPFRALEVLYRLSLPAVSLIYGVRRRCVTKIRENPTNFTDRTLTRRHRGVRGRPFFFSGGCQLELCQNKAFNESEELILDSKKLSTLGAGRPRVKNLLAKNFLTPKNIFLIEKRILTELEKLHSDGYQNFFPKIFSQPVPVPDFRPEFFPPPPPCN